MPYIAEDFSHNCRKTDPGAQRIDLGARRTAPLARKTDWSCVIL